MSTLDQALLALIAVVTPIIAGLLGWIVVKLFAITVAQVRSATLLDGVEGRVSRVESELWPTGAGVGARYHRTVTIEGQGREEEHVHT